MTQPGILLRSENCDEVWGLREQAIEGCERWLGPA
jgi:hypothetical protein